MLVFTVLVGLAFTGAALAALVPLFAELDADQRARTAADAAALAGVSGGRDAAVDLARANGAELLTWERDGRSVTVTVDVAGRTARARATDAP